MFRFAVSILALLAVTAPAAARQQTLVVRAESFHSGQALHGARVQLYLAGALVDEFVTNAVGVVDFTVSGVSTETLPTADFRVGAPWPNPAAGVTRIPVSLDAAARVEAHLFDLLGRRVAMLEHDLSAGSHVLEIDAAGLAGGLYLVSLAKPGSPPRTASFVVAGQVAESADGMEIASLAWSESAQVEHTALEPIAWVDGTATVLIPPAHAAKGPAAGEYELRASAPGHLDGTFYVDVRQTTSAVIRLFPGFVNAAGSQMLEVPPGVFVMGSNVNGHVEYPAHPVAITRPFWLGRYEVRAEEYRAVTGKVPLNMDAWGNRAAGLSWLEGIAFLNELSVREGLARCYTPLGVPEMDLLECPGYRYPTEAEWEYALRAGTTTRYFFGDRSIDLPLYARFVVSSSSTPSEYTVQPVGALLPNPWGFHDILGNAGEFVEDLYGRTAYLDAGAWEDPRGEATGTNRVLRGGPISSLYDAADARSSYRASKSPANRDSRNGMRIARSVPTNAPSNRPPDVPTAPSPADGSTVAPGFPLWAETSDPDGDPLHVAVLLWDEAGQLVVETDLPSTGWPTTSLTAGRTYRWRLAVHDGRRITLGPEWSVSIAQRDPAPFETLANASGIEMTRLPAGRFVMGADFGHSSHRPAREVTLTRPFWISIFEIRAGDFYPLASPTSTVNPTDFRLPVTGASRQDIARLANAVSAAEGLDPCYDASGNLLGNPYECRGYRLPTEAEWEYAARAGTTTDYSFGDDLSVAPEYAWYSPVSGGNAHPTGVLKPNPWGLYDIHGNAAEIVQDWYDPEYYGTAPDVDPAGPQSGSQGLARGGSYGATLGYATSYLRLITSGAAGIRLVRSDF